MLKAPRLVVASALLLTTVFWAWAKIDMAQEDLFPWRAPAQLTALWTMTLLSLSLLVGTQARVLEPFFGGLDHAIALHRWLGPAAVLLAACHILLLVPPRWPDAKAIADLFIPWYSEDAFTFDALGFWLLAALAGLAYLRRLPYETWQWLHRGMAVLFLAIGLHSIEGSESVQAHEPLRFWMVLLTGAGLLAFLYRLVLFRRMGPRHGYSVAAVTQRGADVLDLELRPQERRMTFDPGSFVFISVPATPGVPRQLHPFSISSSPVERDLRLSIRQVGDYTRALPKLRPGHAVDVYGPFGGFTPNAFVGYRRLVLIGAGIGVTPFLSMLRFELANNDFRRIWLYYCVRDRAEAVYDSEIAGSYEQADSWVDYTLWVSGERGRLTAQMVADAVAPFDDYAVMLCGSRAFMTDLRAQFRALGLPDSRIIFEEFDLR